MKVCTCCKKAPADSYRRNYCGDCARTYQRDWARKHRGCKPRLAPPRPLEAHEKFCCKCKRILSRDMFWRETRAGDGLMSHCKGCEKWRQYKKYHKRPATSRRKQRVRSARFRAMNPGYNARAIAKYSRQRKREQLQGVIERMLR